MKTVIYCRVSTDEEIQMNALASQIREAELAANTDEWVLVDRYIDEGKSGTTTKNRNEYNRLLTDMESDKFDIIVVKSQDRLMRNTREWYIFVDKLVQCQKQLYFYLDNRFYTPDDALITGIKAILSEEYSRDLSRKINNAHRHRQESGSALVLTSKTWGYDKIDKKTVINKEEAEVVRLIFTLYASGMGSRTISKELYNRGIKSRSGSMFQAATVRSIIRNPLYMGTAVMNRYHYDFNSKKTLALPEEAWIIHENAIPAIIDEETWKTANRIMDERAVKLQGGNYVCKRGLNKGQHDLSGRIVCGLCGSTYWRRSKRNSKGEETYYWSCSEYVQHGRLHNNTNRGKSKKRTSTTGGCDNIHLNDMTLMDALHRLTKKVFQTDKDSIVDDAVAIMQKIIFESGEDDIEKLQAIRDRIKEKREKLLTGYLSDIVEAGLYKQKDQELQRELDKVQADIDSIRRNSHKEQERLIRLSNLKDEVIDIADMNLGIKKLLSFVEDIKVYPESIDVDFAWGETEHIHVNRINYRRVELLLDEKEENSK